MVLKSSKKPKNNPKDNQSQFKRNWISSVDDLKIIQKHLKIG